MTISFKSKIIFAVKIDGK